MKTALICLALVACGTSTQQTTIKTSLAVVDATRAAFYAYDKAHRDQLRNAAKTPAELADAVTVWLKEESMVLMMLQTAYRGIAVYSTLKDDPTSLQNLNSALGMLEAEMAALGVH